MAALQFPIGMFGVREFAAVINPPHGGILAVGAGEQRPIVIDGDLSVATVMTVTYQPIIGLLTGWLVRNGYRPLKGLLKTQLLCFCKSLRFGNSPRNKPIVRIRFAD